MGKRGGDSSPRGVIDGNTISDTGFMRAGQTPPRLGIGVSAWTTLPELRSLIPRSGEGLLRPLLNISVFHIPGQHWPLGRRGVQGSLGTLGGISASLPLLSGEGTREEVQWKEREIIFLKYLLCARHQAKHIHTNEPNKSSQQPWKYTFSILHLRRLRLRVVPGCQ